MKLDRQKAADYLPKENKIYSDGRAGRADGYYLSALYLLFSTKNELYKKTNGYIGSDSIDFEEMLAERDFSSEERKLVKLAANLFNGSIGVSPTEIIDTVDGDFKLAMQAIILKRTGCHVKELLPVTKKVYKRESQVVMHTN